MSGGVRKRVCVIGAGVSGLSTALHIVQQNQNVDVMIVSDKMSPHTTSDVAGAIWRPVKMIDYSEAVAKTLRKFSITTRDHLQHLMTTGRGPESGVQHMAGIDIAKTSYKIDGNHIDDQAHGFLLHRYMTEDEGKSVVPQDIADRVMFVFTFLVHMTTYLDWLRQQFVQSGRGSISQRRVNSLLELAGTYDVIVNCSGLGSRELVGDKAVQPIRGQIVLMKAPFVKTFFINTVDSKPAYIFPRRDDVAVGGSMSVGNWDTKPDPKIRNEILQRAYILMPSLRSAEIIGECVGLRPYREGGPRVEKEVMHIGGIPLKIVHNYGHGGHGIILHWGCAIDASQMVQQFLNMSQL